MLKKKALAYKNYVLEAEKAFNLIMKERENLDIEELGRMKHKFKSNQFHIVFAEFETELFENCKNYNNNKIIRSFLGVTFSDECKNTEINTEVINTIIVNDFEVEFLLKLYEEIKDQRANFNFLCELGVEDPFNSLDSYLNNLRQPKENIEENNTLPNPLFVFENLRKEINQPDYSVKEKLKTVQQRLFDFLQWQTEFDTINTWLIDENDSKYEITGEFYPKFEDLCRLEIKRLEAILKTEEMHVPPKKKPSEIYVASKKNTEVIKILSAMYDLKLFVDKNGKPLTNKQKMMETFGEFLNEDYTSYSTSLTQAKGRDYDTFQNIFDDLKKASKKYLEK